MNRNHLTHALAAAALGSLLFGASVSAQSKALEIAEVVDVAPVWSGHPVRFALLTHGTRQFVAFYDAQRQMTVGSRALDSKAWQLVRLPTAVGWDSHNSIVMAVDDEGDLHLSGNMHNVPLIYFRTTRPGDVTSFQRVAAMTGRDEHRCTYPRFLRGAGGELIFTYRIGKSGNGERIFNIYDPPSKTWRRFLDQPLFSGQGKMNAYFQGPVRGADGTFHVCWVWRDTSDCATNHDLCYARSKDLAHWHSSDGRPLKLPITIQNAEIVDPVPPGGGMINGNTRLGFDATGRVVIAYHKFDSDGNTQLYNARRETGGWKIYQTSDWRYRWEFQGGGSIVFEIRVAPVAVEADGSLAQTYRHVKQGSGAWRLDHQTLKPIGDAPRRNRMPREFAQLESDWPGMEVRTAGDSGRSPQPAVRYVLRWETLPSNRDRQHPGDPPPPSILRVYKLREIVTASP